MLNNLDDNIMMATSSILTTSVTNSFPPSPDLIDISSSAVEIPTTSATLTTIDYDEDNEGPDLNINKLILINSVSSQEWKRSTPLKTYSKKSINNTNMAAVSRYGRSHKPRIADDYLSTDKKVSHYLKIDADNQLHYFKSSPYSLYKSPNGKNISSISSGSNTQQSSPRKRGRPRKIRTLSDSGIGSLGVAGGLSTPESADLSGLANIKGGSGGPRMSIGARGEKLRRNVGQPLTVIDLTVPIPTSTETLPLPPELMDQVILGSSDTEEGDTLSEVNPLDTTDDSLSATYPPGTTVEMGPDGQPKWMVGDLAWACVGGFPYWPCTVTRDPFENAFTKLKFVGKYRKARDLIHVRFFGDHGRRSWIHKFNIFPFQGVAEFQALAEEKCTPQNKKKFPRQYKSFTVSNSIKKVWQAAVSEAESLREATRSERIKYFTDAFPIHVSSTPTKLKKTSQESRTPTTIVSSGSKKGRKSLKSPIKIENQSDGSRKRKSETPLNASAPKKIKVDEVQIKTEPGEDVSVDVKKVDLQPSLTMEIKAEPQSPEKKVTPGRGRPRKTDSKNSTPVNQPQLVVSLTKLKMKDKSVSPAVRGRGRPRKYPKIEDLNASTPPFTTPTPSTPSTSAISSEKKKVPARPVKKIIVTSKSNTKNGVIGNKKIQQQTVNQRPSTTAVTPSLPVADNPFQEKKKSSKLGPGFASFCEKHFDQVADEDPSLSPDEVNKYLEKMWSQLSDAVKARYRSKTQEENEIESESDPETDSRRSPPQAVTSGSKPVAVKRGVSLFSGVKSEKVCSVCFKSGEAGEIVKCKGPCCNYFHLECSTLPRYQHAKFLPNPQFRRRGRRAKSKSAKHFGKVSSKILLKETQTSDDKETIIPIIQPSQHQDSIQNGLLDNSVENTLNEEDLSIISVESTSKLNTTDSGNTLFDSLSLVKADAVKSMGNNNKEKTENNKSDVENENVTKEKVEEEKAVDDDQSEGNLVINDDCTQDTEMSGLEETKGKEDNITESGESVTKDGRVEEDNTDTLLSLPEEELKESEVAKSSLSSENVDCSEERNEKDNIKETSEDIVVNEDTNNVVKEQLKEGGDKKISEEMSVDKEGSKEEEETESTKVDTTSDKTNDENKETDEKQVEDKKEDTKNSSEDKEMSDNSAEITTDKNDKNMKVEEEVKDEESLEKTEKSDVKDVVPVESQITENALKEEQSNESDSKVALDIKRELANDDKQSVDSDKSTDKQSIDSDKSQTGKSGWVCGMCTEAKDGPCFICGADTGDLVRCSTTYCGKVYHMKCLANWPQRQVGQSAKGKLILYCPQHTCHTCISDNPSSHTARYSYDKLVRCVACPSSYHYGNYCIPAGSELLSTTQMICPRHYIPLKDSLVHVNASWCSICAIGGSLICCDTCPNSFHAECLKIDPPEGSFICEDCETGRIPLYGEVVWVKLGAYRWWPARILYPLEVPENIRTMNHSPVGEFVVEFFGSHDYFWINRGRAFFYHEGDGANILCKSRVDELFISGMNEASEAFRQYQEERESREANSRPSMKPPKYVKIQTNKPYGTLRSAESDVASMTACECDPEKENPCGRNSDCINRLLMVECNPQICPAGEKCHNQNFEKRLYPPLTPYRTETRGWGLKTLVPLKKGDFVIEYVGEMIDEEEYKKRVIRKQKNKDENYYFLTIDKDRMLDAGPKGNMARFMNHSCDPNCETQKWTVNGDTRVGLFTLVDIPGGTELVFNYNLETIGNTRVDCKCGASFCGGYIGAKVNKQSEEKKNSVSSTKKKKQGKKSVGNANSNGNGSSSSGSSNKNSSTKVTENTCFTCGEGGELLLCDHNSCPKAYHLDCLGLTKHPPGNWECPRHVCSRCSSTKVQRCTHCINSYCDKHADGNITLHRTHGLVCFSCTPSESGSDWSGEPSDDDEPSKKSDIPQSSKNSNSNKNNKLLTSRRGRPLIPNGNLH